jgi:lipooligosaccharide transport system permease protein
MTYRQFIFGGIVAQTLMFQGFLKVGSFIRCITRECSRQCRDADTLSEFLWAELIWDASKATFAASAVLMIGVVTGDFSLAGALVTLPIAFLSGLLFAALGLLVAAKSKTIEEINYPQYLLIFPMFLFCGVFFPLGNLPVYLQWIAWMLPLTAVVSIVRTLTLGTRLEPGVFVVIPLWLVVLTLWSRSAMSCRLIK